MQGSGTADIPFSTQLLKIHDPFPPGQSITLSREGYVTK